MTHRCILFVLVVSSGCVSPEHEERIADLEQRLSFVTEKLSTVDSTLISHQGDIGLLEFASQERPTVAAFDPSAPGGGYGIMADISPPLALLVSLETAEPQLRGLRLGLRVGNPHDADFYGGALTFTWGPQPFDRSKERTSRVPFTEILRGGAWTDLTATIAPAHADSVSYINIGIDVDEVRLATPQ